MLVTTHHEQSIFGCFLSTVVDEYRIETKSKPKKNEIEVTNHDRLKVLRGVKIENIFSRNFIESFRQLKMVQCVGNFIKC